MFIIDDVLGVFDLDMAEFNKLKKYQDRIKDPSMSDTKTLMMSGGSFQKRGLIKSTFHVTGKTLIPVKR